jgi:hypothetical protein
MSRWIAFAVVFGTVVVSGAASGLHNGRWGSSRALQDAAARVDQVPLSLGANWDVQPEKLPERAVVIADLEGYTSRRYLQRRTGAMVSVLVVCGRPGPISVHSPDICYAGQGFVESGRARSYTPPSNPSCQFQVLDFRKSNVANPTLLRVFLSWGSRGEWSVPAQPRFAFAGRPYLYKLYVVQELNKANEPIEGSPAAKLIEELMPQLQETLFRGS